MLTEEELRRLGRIYGDDLVQDAIVALLTRQQPLDAALVNTWVRRRRPWHERDTQVHRAVREQYVATQATWTPAPQERRLIAREALRRLERARGQGPLLNVALRRDS